MLNVTQHDIEWTLTKYRLNVDHLVAPLVRVRRDGAAKGYGEGYTKGRVGPVYTFVKTDPKANFKWGVRHNVGTQYGR